MQPYTYLIRWPQLNISYYGVRYAQDCNPSDLWNPYKTSSHHVKEFIKENGEPTVIQVRKVFANAGLAQEWEHRVLQRMKVVSNDQWLNRNDRMAPPILKGETHPNKRLEIRAKISASHKAKGESHHNKLQHNRDKIKNSMLAFGNNHPMKDPIRSGENHAMKRLENRAKAVINNTGSNNPMFGKKQEQKTCPHCNNTSGVNTYARWHGDKCKSNLTSLVANTDR
jgi:hypothetical protein